MFKSSSRFMSGIRLGSGISLEKQQKKENWINGITEIKSKGHKSSTNDSKDIRQVTHKLIKKINNEEPLLLDEKANRINKEESNSKSKSKRVNHPKGTNKKKRGRQLQSKDKNMSAQLLNCIPGSTCPRCGRRFRGFNRDIVGSMSTKCCNHMTFVQKICN